MRKPFTIEQVTVKQAENGGWIAMELKPSGVRQFMAAFSTKMDLLRWLGGNLASDADDIYDELVDDEKAEGRDD